jgi:hypothetical protein
MPGNCWASRMIEFTAWDNWANKTLKDTSTPGDVHHFQLHLIESGPVMRAEKRHALVDLIFRAWLSGDRCCRPLPNCPISRKIG